MITPDETCLIPAFLGQDLRFEYMEYSPVAYQAHLGDDDAGHYRTAIRLRPGVTEDVRAVRWLLCDDHCSPVAVWDLPPWFQANSTIAWLIRTDLQGFFQYGDRSTGMDQDPIQSMLELFAEAVRAPDPHLDEPGMEILGPTG